MKKITTYILILTLLIFNIQTVSATSGGGSFADDAFVHDSVLNGYKMTDDSSLPNGKYFYYKYDDGKAWYCDLGDAISLCSNKRFGLTYNTSVLTGLMNYFDTYYLGYTGSAPSQINGVYTNQNVLVGWALNNLSGCQIVNPNNNNPEIPIDSNTSNYLYVYVNQYLEDNYARPDYINIETRPKDFFLNKLDQQQNTYQALANFLNSDDYSINNMVYNPNTLIYSQGGNLLNYPYSDMFIVSTSEYQFDYYNLGPTKNTVNFTDMLLSTIGFETQVRLKSNISSVVIAKSVRLNTDGTYSVVDKDGNARMYYYIGGRSNLPCSSEPVITIYRSTSVLNQFLNGTYAPSYYTSSDYYNYDSSSSDNTFTTTTNEIDNSTETNTTIYNETSESFQEYYTENNYHVDNSVTIETNQTIINNYYGDNSGDDDSGGSGGDDDDDSGILDKLIDAILGLFKSIGKILAAVLNGIVDLLSSILETIADISTSFDGITNLFSAVFGWLPDSIVNLMVLGLGLALLAAFITWFR